MRQFQEPSVTYYRAGVVALALLFLMGCYSSLKPPLSASLADPWDALLSLRPGDKVSVHVGAGIVDDRHLRLRGRFVSVSARQLTIRMNVDRFSRTPRTGALTLFVPDESTSGRRRQREIEFVVAGATVRRGEVEVSFGKAVVSHVFKPNIYRWAGPLIDCGYVALPASGIGTLAGWAAGSASKGTLIGAALGCGLGVLFWYGDRSDTAGLEWDLIYRRPGAT